MTKFGTSDYAQMLMNGVDNFTATYFAEVINVVSHDTIGRSIASIKLSPKVVRDKALELIIPSTNGYIAIDDTVLDHGSSEEIEVASAQYSGQKHGITTGIGVVTLVYINPEINKYWILDYRIYDKSHDGIKKTAHALEMIRYWHEMSTKEPERAPFTTVLIDAGYTCKEIMKYLVSCNKLFFGVMPKSRKISFEQDDPSYQVRVIINRSGKGIVSAKVGDLVWEDDSPLGERLRSEGQLVCVEFLPKNIKLRLFLITAKHRKEYLVTNQIGIVTTEAAKKVGGFRWKIEQFHREAKQLTGLSKCQARKGRKQRNHIAIAFVVWLQLNELAGQFKQTIYQIKKAPLLGYQKELWKNPAYRLDANLVGFA